MSSSKPKYSHKKQKPKKKKTRNRYKKNGKYREESKKNHPDHNDPHSSEHSHTRIWICSWNMAAKDHFKFKTTYDGRKIADDDETQKFEQIVPTNYDLYIFGVQEGVSDTFFKYISLYLSEFNVQRITLNNNGNTKTNHTKNQNKKSLNKNANCFGVHGRGDGSFLTTKFTGIAVYYRKNLSPYISLKSQAAVSCGLTQGSKGAACILLKIYSSTIAFLSTHMSSNSTDAKLEHFKILVNKSGDTLGCSGFDLLTQFHHIIWFGDLNYRIQTLTADNVLQNMALGNLNKLWSHDSLSIEWKKKGKQCAFKNFREPKPRLDFYPTYKKKPNRQLDFDQNPLELRTMSASSQQSSLSQLDKIYTTKYKEPFYKGGSVHDRTPSFCDRVLYHSLNQFISGDLKAELDTGVLNCVEFSYKKDKCNNYGCIPHHLMGSDHSAIYCGLTLKSPMLFPCPPHELTDQGQPMSYQLKIEDIKILRKSPYHMDSTYSEFPLKTKILFPAPYEIENFKYKNHKPCSYTILQQDFETYHHILRQIDMESKRRLSFQNRNKNKQQNIPLMTPQTSQRHRPLIPITPFNLMDPEDDNQDTLIAAKPVVDKGLNSKKIKRGDKSDDDWGDSMPSFDVLTHPENDNNNAQKGLRSSSASLTKSPNRMIKETSSEAEYYPDIDANNNKMENKQKAKPNITPRNGSRRDSAPNVKKRHLPSDYIFKSEESTEIEKQQINKKYKKYQNKNKKPIPKGPPPEPPVKKKKKSSDTPTTPVQQLSPKNSTTSPANNGEFMFSFENYSDNHTFKLSTTKAVKPQRMNKNTGIAKNNPIHAYLQDKGDIQLGAYNTKPTCAPLHVQSQLHNKSLNSSIQDDYFDAKHNEDSNDIISPIHIQNNSGDIEFGHIMDNSQSPSSLLLRRGRSKSMGSFAETMEKAMRGGSGGVGGGGDHDDGGVGLGGLGGDEMNGIVDENLNLNVNKHNMTRSELMDIEQHNHISSPIYKDLAEMSKKLTINSFGPSRRPTKGHIHCVLKVEGHDFKGQCCIPFKWSDFGKKVEATKYADLCYHGIPLYDKTGSPVKCKIRYKVSLIDKQIVFDNH